MADILIKNTNKPKYCFENVGQVVKPCEFLEVCRRRWCVNINALDVHSEACPIVELPTHGRLIDAEKLQAVLAKWEERARCGGNDEFADAYKTVREIIDDRDCVVEANNE